MGRPPLVQFHVSPKLHRRLQRLRSERDINLSAWLRRLVARELDQEFGAEPDAPAPAPSPEPKTPPGPIPGWKPWQLEDGEWGARFEADIHSLPADLVDQSIQVTTKKGASWTASVVEVICWEKDYVLVRHSGKPSDAA